MPGMFGSFVEYTLKNINTKLDTTQILDDGSMHFYQKDYHVADEQVFASKPRDVEILSIVYPWKKMHLDEILLLDQSLQDRKTIFLHADNLKDRELNLLFHYYKCAFGVDMQFGLELYKDPDEKENVKKWNSDYQTLSDMQPWEYREWFSYYYPQFTQEWQDSQYLSTLPVCMKISNSRFIHNLQESMESIMAHCEVRYNKDKLRTWCSHYLNSQKYILSKFDLLQQICNAVMAGTDFSWEQLTIVEEAIIQQRFRSAGYEIECDGLNQFPMVAKDLQKIMYQIK